MDAVVPMAHGLGWLLRRLRAAGFGPARALSEGEIKGTAHILSAGLLGAWWDRTSDALDWAEVSARWERHVAGTSGVDPTLYGEPHPDDQLALVTDNAEAFELRARLFAGAERSIDVATYYIQGDATGRRVVDALAAAVRRGVRVRLLADAYITEKKEFEGLGSRAIADELDAAGVEVQLWHDEDRPYDAQHRKMLVVDGRHVLIGGRNHADHYAGPLWRDLELYLSGPSAADAQAVYDRSFAGLPEPSGVSGRLFFATRPVELLHHPNVIYLLQCIRAARRTIDVENAYYFSHDAIFRALSAARARGVRVRIFTNSTESNDLDFANWRLSAGFGPMIDAGFELYLRQGKGRTLHSKYWVIDEEWVSVGSSNLDYYSPRHSTECNVQARSAALGAMLTRRFEDGLPGAARVTDRAAIEAQRAGLGLSRLMDTLIRDQQ